MENYHGACKMLQGSLVGDRVDYHWTLGEQCFYVGNCIGRSIIIEHTGEKHCVSCGRSVKKTFQNGYCFPCTQRLAECDLCIVKPELCHYDQGTCRDENWGQTHCMMPHFVYMAYTSGIKVGITRQVNLPKRWIDQGAVAGIKLYQVSSRYLSGLIEVELAKSFNDKTNWRKMLSDQTINLDLHAQREALHNQYQPLIQMLCSKRDDFKVEECHDPALSLTFPVQAYLSKINSLNLDKTPRIEGVLRGIKGQYLILEHGVLNVRKYSGYTIKVTIV